MTMPAEMPMSSRRGRSKPAPAAGLKLVPPVAPAPPAPRGRALSPEQVIELLPTQRNGKKPSRWWVMQSFFPEGKRKIGKTVFWWEHEVALYLDQQFANNGEE